MTKDKGIQSGIKTLPSKKRGKRRRKKEEKNFKKIIKRLESGIKI